MFCRKVLILLSAVCSLNAAFPEPYRSASACQADLVVDTIENVIRGGGDVLLMDGPWPESKTNLMDQSIACN